MLGTYRSTPHATTGETPNRLMLGREVTTPLTLLAPPVPNMPGRPPWIESLHENFADAHRLVQEHFAKAQRVQKQYYDKKVKLQTYEVGQQVWLWNNRRFARGPHKLNAERWEGPLEVKRRISSAVYFVGKHGEPGGRVVSVAHLTPYIQRREDLQVAEVVQPLADVRQIDSDDDEPVNEVQLPEPEAEAHEQDVLDSDDDAEVEQRVVLPVHRRPQRAARNPRWMADYVQDYNDDDD